MSDIAVNVEIEEDDFNALMHMAGYSCNWAERFSDTLYILHTDPTTLPFDVDNLMWVAEQADAWWHGNFAETLQEAIDNS